MSAAGMGTAAEHIDVDALFAPPTEEESAAVWETFPNVFQPDRFRLLGEPVEADGVVAQHLEHYSEGLLIYGSLYRPADASRGPYPLLLANHGGFVGLRVLRPVTPAVIGAGQFNPFAQAPNATERHQRPFEQWCWDLAAAGYVVLASSYRGEETPVGRSDGEGEGGKGEVTDVLNLLECGKTLPYVDGGRIGMWGTSHGAWITAFAAQRSPDLKAGISFAAPANIYFRGIAERGQKNAIRAYVEQLVSGGAPDSLGRDTMGRRATMQAIFQPLVEGKTSVEQARREMIARTVYPFVAHTRCPLLLVCGDADGLYEHALELDEALARAGKEHGLRIFPGADHGFQYAGPAHALECVWNLTLEFFGRRLSPSATAG